MKLTDRQVDARDVLAGPASHCMLFGGSRSGKTFLIIRTIVMRALAVEKSRHVILRYRFNHLKASVIYDTLPKVMDLCFPGVAGFCKLDKVDWFYKFPNGSEIWFGGLDEKERTEKILGQEYATLFFNECSQIPYQSRIIALTRLAQNTELRLKAYYDCNPPSVAHWTHRLFIEKIDPDRRTKVADPGDYASLRLNPQDNIENLPPKYFETLQNLPDRQRRRFYLGEFASEAELALWTPELLDNMRVVDGKTPELIRVVIAVDPSGCAGSEDIRSDEVGIVVVGLGRDQRGYVLEDLSGRHGPREWGLVVATAYERYDADCIVAEINFGGAMVGELLRATWAAAEIRQILPNLGRLVFREVTASRGKVVRAEPIAMLFEQAKVSMVGYFAELEDQLCGLTTAGYIGGRSPDRADAMVWALSNLFPAVTRPKKIGGSHVRVEGMRGWNPHQKVYRPGA